MNPRTTGVAYLFCGIGTAVFWLLHPVAADPGAAHDTAFWEAMQTGRYAAVNGAFVVILIACLFGLTGVHSRQRARAGVLGLVGYLLASIGSAAFIGAGVFQAFVAPVLAADPATRALLEPTGPLLGSSLASVFAGAGMSFLLGYIVFSVATFRAGVFPRVSAVLAGVGSPILGLSPMMPLAVRIIGCLLFGIGTAWQGYVLVTAKDEPAT